jgi:tetratricopeptide (TPR) repeat protein
MAVTGPGVPLEPPPLSTSPSTSKKIAPFERFNDAVPTDHRFLVVETECHSATGKYAQAIENFRQVQDPESPRKFFLHWAWRMMAQLESSNAWLLSGSLAKAKSAADAYLESALSTAAPQLQALAWELKTRVAMADYDFHGARECIEQELTVVDKFGILVAAWQAYATAWQLHQQLKGHKTAEKFRDQAETCILKIANSFEPDEPLRATFLGAAPVRRIMLHKEVNQVTRPNKQKRSAAS